MADTAGKRSRTKINSSGTKEKTEVKDSKKTDLGEKKNAEKGSSRPSIEAKDIDGESIKPDIFEPNTAKAKLRFYFITILALGSALILFPIFSGVMQIVIATGMMVVYYFLGAKFIKYPNSRAVFADSMYYLGFLFTFVALVGAMMRINSSNYDIELIIGQMGPALVTTVVGMAVRIYLTQFEAITDEPEAEAASALGQLAGNLIEALNTINTTSQANAKLMKDFQEKTNEQLQNFTARLNAIDTTSLERNFNQLTQSISSLSTESNSLSGQVKQARSTITNVDAEFKDLKPSLDNLKSNIDTMETFQSDINELDSKIDETTKSFEKISNNLQNKVGVAAQQVNQSVTNISNQLGKTDEEIKGLGKTLKETVTGVVEFLSRQK